MKNPAIGVLGTREGCLRFPSEASAVIMAMNLTDLIHGYTSQDFTRAVVLMYPAEAAAIIANISPSESCDTDFVNGGQWTSANLIPIDVIAAPVGGIDTYKITINTTDGQHRTTNTGASNANTREVFARAEDAGFVTITSNGTTAKATFNLLTGTVDNEVEGVAAITPYPGGWYKLEFTPDVAATLFQIYFGETFEQADGFLSFVGTGKRLLIASASRGGVCITATNIPPPPPPCPDDSEESLEEPRKKSTKGTKKRKLSSIHPKGTKHN